MKNSNAFRLLGASIVALLFAAPAARAQRVSLADLQSRLAGLQQELADLQGEPLVDQEPLPESTLRILSVKGNPFQGDPASLTITGRSLERHVDRGGPSGRPRNGNVPPHRGQ